MPDRRGLGSFRHHLLLTTVLSAGAFAVLVGASIFMPLARALERAEPGSAYSAAIAEHFLAMHATFWPVVLGAMIASIGSGLLLYHRMVGPLVRFVQVYRKLAAGEVPGDVTIRRRDYLTQEAGALNEMLAAVRRRDAERAERVDRCELLIDELEDRAQEAKTRAGLAELRQAIGELR